MTDLRAPRKVGEYRGWEIFTAAPGAFSIRKAGQTVGPFRTQREAHDAIELEEGKQAPDR